MTVSANQTPTPAKQGVRARERNALERITGLEQDFASLVQGIQNAVNETNSKINTISETLAAVVDLFGPETVQKAIADARTRRMNERVEASKKALDEALIAGTLKQIEKIEDSPDVVITGVEKDPEGKAIPPGYVQLPFSTVKPEFKEKMVGQAVGFSFETANKGTFEVTGVYQTVPPSPTVDPADEETAEDEISQ